MTRRGLLGVLGAGVGGLAVGSLTGYARAAGAQAGQEAPDLPTAGDAVEPVHGAHQAGIATRSQAHARFVALDLRAGVDRAALVRLMRVLTDDIERLTSGRPALADPTPELAAVPARLTVTVGFGLGLLKAAGLTHQAPRWLAEGLPRFRVDRLQDRWSDGDLLLQVAADDPVTVTHAVQVLLSDARSFATVRWMQTGFHRAVGTAPAGMTGRNLFGQVDGTVNPTPGTPDFDTVVWSGPSTGSGTGTGIGTDTGTDTDTGTPGWLDGGTALIIRRIAMDLGTWGGLGRAAKEQAIGRRLADGAPLTGGTELTAPDYEALDVHGFPVIPATSHLRLAHPEQPVERILRRPYNYDDGTTGDGAPDTGLLFVACMADPATQFVPIQKRLASADVLNLWTTPIGSALFAVPPGFSEGEYLGQRLLAP